MKRSKMIKLLTDTLNQQAYENAFNHSAGIQISTKECAEWILEDIEKAGMLPPSCEGDKYTSWDDE